MKITIGEKTACKTLPMGGSDKQGNHYEVNSQYLIKNGKPILPIMGEFHFSRWTPEEWEESLLKMKAGGVEIVATYVFWIHHEEKKGEWNFAGNRDIRAFLELCKKVQMPVWLRIGPWAHGECRNGGFPDWLVEELGDNGLGSTKGEEQIQHQARTDDALYLGYVREFWSRLSKETTGMMCAEGGPVLGIQLENEYCHAGGPRDTAVGVQHMKTLKELALECGFVTPYYTATGWGGAIVIDKEMLPVMGGYVDAPWAGHTKEMPASENFLFCPFREDENIGTDLKIEKEQGFTFSKEDNPYLTAELGGGLQVTAMRRTYPFAQDIEAQTVCMLGAGANLLGYYMYHGGYNPEGATSMQESRETGYFNDLPVKSYDFQTCIRESGKVNESFHRLKKVHLMIHDFEERLAPAQAYVPVEKPESAEDMQTPRVSVRYNHDTEEGFLFINNHQRLRHMEAVTDLAVEIEIPGKENIKLSHISCESGKCAIIPFQLNMGESRLLYTNANLLAKVGERYFFYCDEQVKPTFVYEDMPYENVVVLNSKEAEQAYQFGSQFYISSELLIEEGSALFMLTDAKEHKIKIYEEIGEAVELYLLPPEIVTSVEPVVLSEEIGADSNTYELQLSMKKEIAEEMQAEIEEILDIDEQIAIYGDLLHEIYLHIEFAGDRAELYEGDKLIADWFSNGEEWVVALKRFAYPQKLRLKVYPYVEDVYYDLKPKKGCELRHIYAESEYKIEV